MKIKFLSSLWNLTDSTNLIRILKEVDPDEIYNLGAQIMLQLVWSL